jgi:hypothetical protein
MARPDQANAGSAQSLDCKPRQLGRLFEVDQ